MAWYPTLDDMERRPDGPATRRSSRDNREPSTRGLAIGSYLCWCGLLPGHEWPGKADGLPHPGDASARPRIAS